MIPVAKTMSARILKRYTRHVKSTMTKLYASRAAAFVVVVVVYNIIFILNWSHNDSVLSSSYIIVFVVDRLICFNLRLWIIIAIMSVYRRKILERFNGWNTLLKSTLSVIILRQKSEINMTQYYLGQAA